MTNYGLNIIVWIANNLVSKSLEVEHLLLLGLQTVLPPWKYSDVYCLQLNYADSCYWGPTHFLWINNHLQTAIDFAVYRGIACSYLSISESSGLFSDHIPLLIYLSVAAYQVIAKTSSDISSDISSFSASLTALTEDSPLLVTTDDVDSFALFLVDKIHQAAPHARSVPIPAPSSKSEIAVLARKCRTLLRVWMRTRHSLDLARWRAAMSELRKVLRMVKSEKTTPSQVFEIAKVFADDLENRLTPFDFAT